VAQFEQIGGSLSCRFFIYHWSGDKIVRFDMFYDPTNLRKEIAAATKK
jgi:hypothetical protein